MRATSSTSASWGVAATATRSTATQSGSSPMCSRASSPKCRRATSTASCCQTGRSTWTGPVRGAPSCGRSGSGGSWRRRSASTSHPPECACRSTCSEPPSGATQCTWCGAEVAPIGADWKDHAVLRRPPVERAGPHRVASGEFFLIEACCPGCGTLLDTELAAGDDPHRHDRVRRWPDQKADA